MNTFTLNEIVRGIRCGTYVILAFRMIDGVPYAQVKEVHPITHEPSRGEFSLPLTALRKI